jgi:phosphate transport system permease protein
MSLTSLSPRPFRRTLNTSQGWSRVLLERGFAAVAFGATFFGLAMLLVFFVTLGRDVVRWFQTMPARVEQQNARLARQVAEARDQKGFISRRLQTVDEEMKAELAKAKTDREKDKIHADYQGFREKERANLEATVPEVLATEKAIRPDTAPGALLGHFFTAGPSYQPEDAGIKPALLGSLFLVIITVLFAVPLGVGAAIYLEEYRASSPLARVIQVNINNLAGVPSVLYGILGAFVFVELIFKPLESGTIAARNVLGGGMTLALLTLPVIIVSAQEAIRAVPVSLRHAALALGATRWQTVWKVVLPSALPGTLTGIILAMCRALGEAAPLVMFGALLYVNQDPGLFNRFTVMPLQIFNWSDRPADAWRYNAALASAVLVITLLLLNGAAIYLRQRAQRHMKW